MNAHTEWKPAPSVLNRSTIKTFLIEHESPLYCFAGPAIYLPVLVIPFVFPIFALLIFWLGCLVLVLAIVTSLAVQYWFERRIRLARARILEQWLCLGCGHCLHEASIDDLGIGTCTECGRQFVAAMYDRLSAGS